MDRKTILDHLAQARRHVAQGDLHIANQRKVVARLEQGGRDAAKARETLQLFEAMQEMHIADCKRLEKAAEDGETPFSSEDDLRRVANASLIGSESIDELRWYKSKIAETADALERSKAAVEASREILLKHDSVSTHAPPLDRLE